MFLLDRVSCPDTEIRVLRKKKNWVPTSYLQEGYKISRWVFCPMSCSIQGKWRFFLPTSYLQGQWVRKSQGSHWVHQGWSIATKRGREKVKKRKRPRKARRWLQRRQGSVCPKPRIPFVLVHEYLGLEAAHLGWSIGSCVSFLQGNHVRRKVQKWTTLRSKSSTLKGLLYAPIQQKQYHKRTTLRRLKIPLQSIVAWKVRTIALEQSAKKAVMRHAINAIWHGYVENPAANHS